MRPNDPRLVIYEVSRGRSTSCWTRSSGRRLSGRKVERKKTKYTPPAGSAEDVATKALNQRRTASGRQGGERQIGESSQVAETGETARGRNSSSEGVPEPEAKQIAVEYVRSNVKFLFQEADIPGNGDVRRPPQGGHDHHSHQLQAPGTRALLRPAQSRKGPRSIPRALILKPRPRAEQQLERFLGRGISRPLL